MPSTLSQRRVQETEDWLDRLGQSAPSGTPRRLGRPSAAEQRVRRWQGATTTRLNQTHWGNVSGQPINAELASYLDTLRFRAQDEISKNPLLEGMISTYTLSCLGSTGPTLQVRSGDANYDRQREANWNGWAEQAGSNQQLGMADIMRLWIRGLFDAGEFLDQFIVVPDAPGPVKMRLLPIEATRLLTPPEFLGDHSVALGVRRDLKNRRPLCYYVSQPYIMGAFEVYTGEFIEIPYRDLLHGFMMLEPDQIRGVPWIAPCLDDIADLRDYEDSTLDAARAAADWGVYIYSNSTDIPGLQMSAQQTPPDMPFERQQERYLPPGWKPEQVSPQQPPANWQMFYTSRVQRIGRCVNMPLMMMLLDSSSHNYSSARFDGQLYWRGIGYVQGAILGRSLNRIEGEVAREAELAYLAGDPQGIQSSGGRIVRSLHTTSDGFLHLPGGKIIKSSPDVIRSYQQANPGIIVCHWLWPVAPHVDPQKEREADRLGMQNGDTTYADLCARNNRDWREVIEERKEINAALRAAGLPEIPGIPDPSKAAGAGAAGGPAGGEKSQPAQDDGWAKRSADGWAPDREQVLRHLLGINGNGHSKV